MNQSHAQSSFPVSLPLVLIASIMVGFVGGYLFGQQGPIAASTQTTTGPCPNELDPADAYIIAGFVCPAPACQDQMSACHCEIAHDVKNQVKQELGQGKEGSRIRADLQQQYGAQLKPIS